MGLIEKVFADHENGDVSARNAERSGRLPDNVQKLHRDGRKFDIDFSYLARQGFYVPEEEATRLSLELRLLKRRLLRRLGFLRSQSSPEVAARRASRQRNLVMVTSTRPAEGKTFTSINLALSLALEDDVDVLLVDADSPRPKVQSHFGLREQTGLTDLILDQRLRLSDVCLTGQQAPLTILPEGSPVDRSAELYGSVEGQKIITDISRYRSEQVVIIDAPPVLATTEAVVLAPYVDEILFVVEADSTPEQAIASAVEELLDVNPNVSLVLNKCLIGAGGSHYGSYSDYYPRGAKRSVSQNKRSTQDMRNGS